MSSDRFTHRSIHTRVVHAGPTNRSWRRGVAEAHPGTMPSRACNFPPATPSSSTCLAAKYTCISSLSCLSGKICAHLRVDQFLVSNMVESYERVVECGSHRVPVCCGPVAPRRLLPDAALHAARIRGPEKAFSVGGLPQLGLNPSKLALHTQDGEEEANGPPKTVAGEIPVSACQHFALLE